MAEELQQLLEKIQRDGVDKANAEAQSIVDKAKKEAQSIVDKGYDDALGARPLKRIVQRYIEDPLAEMMLKGDLPSKVKVTHKKDAEALSFS